MKICIPTSEGKLCGHFGHCDSFTFAEINPETKENSTIIASHMDTVSHLTVTREDIKALKLNNVVVPNDNEILEFN